MHGPDSQTKLCKHFNEDIALLTKYGDIDLEGGSLLERYKAKYDVERKQFKGQDANEELKLKVWKYFLHIDCECKFKEGCYSTHNIEESFYN